VAHSPDSDDAFMFYALATGKLDTEGRSYVHELADIETLNRGALAGTLDVTAVSFHAYAHMADRYALLAHGAALAGRLVGIPGELTTACLALRLYQPSARTRILPFDAIEDAVVRGEVEVGLLIHEGQLTFADRGLHLWEDLGEWWAGRTGLPLPLGGNVVRKDLGADVVRAVARDLKASIVWGLAHRAETLAHAQGFARGMDERRTDQFVGMYVNDYTVDLGPTGRQAVQRLLDEGHRAGVLPARVEAEFVSA